MKRSSKRRRQPGKLTTSELTDPAIKQYLRERLGAQIDLVRSGRVKPFRWTRSIAPTDRYIQEDYEEPREFPSPWEAFY